MSKVIFANAIESSSIYFSLITVFHDISKQIQERARKGKILARMDFVYKCNAFLHVTHYRYSKL